MRHGHWRAILGLLVIAGWIGCVRPDKTAPSPTAKPATVAPALTGSNARLVTSRGVIGIEFFTKDAPKTVQAFQKLAAEGKYDGRRFHYVEPRIAVQTPGKPEVPFADESPTDFGETSPRRHFLASVGLALTKEPVRPLYICLRPMPELDGKHPIFARVIEGFDVLASLREGDVLERVLLGVGHALSK